MPPPPSEYELRRSVTKVCRSLAERGLTSGTDGNASARLPSGRILMTPSGVSKGVLREEDLLVCSPEGRPTGGKGRLSRESLLHLAVYRERPDAGAVVHAHPPVASAFTFAGRADLLAEPVLPDAWVQLGPVPTVPYSAFGTKTLAEASAEALRDHQAVLLAQHGAVTVGKDPWEAYLRMEKLEHAATVVKAALELAGGDPARLKRLSREQVAELMSLYGRA